MYLVFLNSLHSAVQIGSAFFSMGLVILLLLENTTFNTERLRTYYNQYTTIYYLFILGPSVCIFRKESIISFITFNPTQVYSFT